MVGGNALYLVQDVGMRAVDLETWESRSATLKEHGDFVRALDALDTVHGFQAYEFYMEMEGVPPSMVMLEGLASGIRNTTKMQCMGYGGDSEKFAIKMAKTVGIDLLGALFPSPPLTLFTDSCEGAFSFAEADFPVIIVSGAVMGATAPVTFAGATITQNAEAMAGIVLLQLIKPGAKAIVMDGTHPMNMRNGNMDFGAMGISLHYVMFNQIWRSYGIPTGAASTFSSSKKIDFQNAYERAMQVLTGAISGNNLTFFQGAMYGELTCHPVQAVLDNDIAGWVGHFLEGVEVNDETLALDLINQVGPIPGNYLTTAHTRKWYKEHFVPKVADRESYPEWIKKGKKDALTLAKERLEEILATHKPKPLTPEQDKAIAEILEEARSFYREKGML